MTEIEAIVILLAAVAALARIEELVVEDWVREDTAERVQWALQLPPQPLQRPLRRRRGPDRGRLRRLPTPLEGVATSATQVPY